MAATSKAAPATPEQIARNGHAAATIRQAMERKGWTPRRYNEAAGHPSGHTQVYVWLAAKGAPGRELRPKVAKLLGVKAEDLAPRELERPPRAAVPVKWSPAPPVTLPASRQAAGDVLSFAVDRTGQARLRLDLVLPLERGAALLRMLLDAGIAMGEAGD